MERNILWERYFYSGTNVLINRLDITNAEILANAERRITAITLAYCRENPVKGGFDLKHLCQIHKEIFGDLYPFAGKLRDVEMAKSEPFTKAMLIPTYAVDFSSVTPEENLKASVDSYYKEYRTMHKMFERITEPISAEERREFCKKFGFPLKKFVNTDEN